LPDITRNDFKRLLRIVACLNLESFYPQTEELFFPTFDLRHWEAPWEPITKLLSEAMPNSPHKFVKNWDTPIMIIVGEHDYRIPYTQSLEAFGAAQLLGVPSKLLFFTQRYPFCY
jgi:dipeptidyl aminopeptidase/acylaminoacyl peptidase